VHELPIKVAVMIISIKVKIESALEYLILTQKTRQKSLTFSLVPLPE
jgi:hypothetical protein